MLNISNSSDYRAANSRGVFNAGELFVEVSKVTFNQFLEYFFAEPRIIFNFFFLGRPHVCDGPFYWYIDFGRTYLNKLYRKRKDSEGSPTR